MWWKADEMCVFMCEFFRNWAVGSNAATLTHWAQKVDEKRKEGAAEWGKGQNGTKWTAPEKGRETSCNTMWRLNREMSHQNVRYIYWNAGSDCEVRECLVVLL